MDKNLDKEILCVPFPDVQQPCLKSDNSVD